MRRKVRQIIIMVLVGMLLYRGTPVQAEEKPELKLYARAALLMDAANGRVLYEENGYSVLPMASTTKIMTCMIALESGKLNEYCTVSDNAAVQPKVKLGLRKNRQYLLNDLLYSLMLESHNDSAVVIAEHVAGSVDAFCVKMNEKAAELGCVNTCFLTPNGLDARKGSKQHATTAYELALIASWAIQNKDFVGIINTRQYSFSDRDRQCTHTVHNKDRFLDMEDGAIGIKTGFTGDAGYCFVGAVKDDERTFISVVLGCGWPPNKNWKWKDTGILMRFGKDNYHYQDIPVSGEYFTIPVIEGTADSVGVCVRYERMGMLLSEFDVTEERIDCPQNLNAPVVAGTMVGRQEYLVNGEIYASYGIYTTETVGKRDFWYCLTVIWSLFSL